MPSPAPAPAHPWRHGDRLHLASIAAAAFSIGLAALALEAAGPVAAMFVVVGGVGLNLVLGRLWALLPRTLTTRERVGASAYAAFGAWQTGVALTALSWTGTLNLDAWASQAGPLLMLTSTLLLADHFGGGYARAWRANARTRHLLAGLVPAGICIGGACVVLALGLRAEGWPALRDIGLSLLIFGGLVPAGVASLALKPPRSAPANDATLT